MAAHATTASIPLQLLHDAKGTIVTVEMDSGEIWRGQLTTADDSMNVELRNATVINPRKGETAREVPVVFLRGTGLVFFQLAKSLQTAPALLSVAQGAGKKAGFGGGGKPSGGAAGAKRGRDNKDE